MNFSFRLVFLNSINLSIVDYSVFIQYIILCLKPASFSNIEGPLAYKPELLGNTRIIPREVAGRPRVNRYTVLTTQVVWLTLCKEDFSKTWIYLIAIVLPHHRTFLSLVGQTNQICLRGRQEFESCQRSADEQMRAKTEADVISLGIRQRVG